MGELSDIQGQDRRLNEMVEFLTEGHLGHHGGYPYDFTWVGDTLVIAGLDDGKERNRTEISQYTRQQLLDWYERAAALEDREADYYGPADALYETAGWSGNE